mgnify:CR=1 FL=1|tara:strand:- start:15339 stop:16559 length:1221 start_codon:yes stop_codon:yes gene_type:complete
MSKRILEQLSRGKQQKVTVATGYPSQTDGANGEIQVRVTNDNGPMLFVKILDRWHSTPLHMRHLSKKRDRIVLRQGVSPKEHGELSLNSSGQVTVKSSASATPKVLLDNISDIGNMTFQAGDSDEAFIVIKGGITNGAVSLSLFADKAADKEDCFKLLVEDEATAGDGLRFQTKASDGSFYDMMAIINGGNDAASGSIAVYAPISSNQTITSSTGACSGTGALDTGSSAITTTGTISGGVFVGAPIWREFPFIISATAAGKYYYRDVDDLFGDYRKWDAFDTTPTTFSNRNVGGSFIVPDNCTLVGMAGEVTNFTNGTDDAVISIYVGTPNEAAGNSVLQVAEDASGSDVVTTIDTDLQYAPHSFSATFGHDLTAGDMVVPMISKTGVGVSTPKFIGSLTLKFVTR